MRFAGRVFKSGRFWAIEVPMLIVFSQGRTKLSFLPKVRSNSSSLRAAPESRQLEFERHLTGGRVDVQHAAVRGGGL